MSESREEKAEQIFFEAIELPPAARQPFIDRQCGSDAELRGLVESLLAADEAAGDVNFLESHFLTGASLGFQADTPGSRSGEPTPIRTDSSSDSDLPHPARSNSEVSQATIIQPDSRFRILSRYEQGGLGEVLIAHDGQLNREVAVKQIRLKWQANTEARERFLQEAEVTGRLEHPGIVPVYALGTWEDGRPFYAMRFIQGKTLKQVITEWRESGKTADQQAKRMELRGLLNRFVDVCNTIEYAHSRRILHRDIKPSNIMIGPYGETLVVDWGLAKLLDAPMDESMTAALAQRYAKEGDSSRTQIGGTVGTPQYMSPEQAAGDLESIGVRTDVYLLGATLYQILTGVPPHQRLFDLGIDRTSETRHFDSAQGGRPRRTLGARRDLLEGDVSQGYRSVSFGHRVVRRHRALACGSAGQRVPRSIFGAVGSMDSSTPDRGHERNGGGHPVNLGSILGSADVELRAGQAVRGGTGTQFEGNAIGGQPTNAAW